MKRCPPLWYRAAWAAMLVSVLALGAYGQGAQSGNIFGTVVGSDGGALPGVTVTLTGGGAPQTTLTDAQGRFRFINLSPDTYSLSAELAGYGQAQRGGVTVNIGRNAEVAMTLNPSVSQTITVTAEAPLLDTRRTGTGTTISEVELEEVPTARDPWVILQQVPGVQMDRINVGGNESGQQSTFVSKGITQDEATYSVDGVNTTDMIATGSSSAYYDFGAFEEIQVTTGGGDPRIQTAGAQINIVTKRGTNDFAGSARYFMTPGNYQAEASVPTEAVGYLSRTNEIDDVTEWGAEAGGPIIRDRLWLWAAYADQQIDLFVAQPAGQTVRYADKTSLETLNAKLNAQILSNNSFTAFYTDNQKVKNGRDIGPLRPPETAWNQGAYGPRGTYKLEDTHIFSSSFYLTGMYSKVNGGFFLAADSGTGCTTPECIRSVPKAIVRRFGGEDHLKYRNTYFSPFGERPQEQTRLDGSAFFSTGALNHELKFGFGYRTAGTHSMSIWPQNQYILDFGDGVGLTYFQSSDDVNYEYKYNDIYVGDTMLWGNLTVQAGLRFDRQKASAGDQFGPANSVIPEFLPELRISGGDIDSMEWESISPRIGLTYALGQDKRTLLRASYNRYVGQLGSNTTGYAGVIPVSYRYISFYTLDLNGNDVITRDEILFDYGYIGWSNMDPSNPDAIEPTTRIDSDMEAPTTDEWILGFEHELLRDLVVGLNYTHRDMDKFVGTRTEKHRGMGDYITAADYQLRVDEDGNPFPATRPGAVTEVGNYSVPVYELKEGIDTTWTVLTNLPGYTQSYDGLELSLMKRMSNRWMLRGNFSWNDWKQQVDARYYDPTPQRVGSGCSNCDGAEVVEQSTGSGNKGGVWIDADWALNLAGVYQIPFVETNFGVNFTTRQGYPILYVHNADVTQSGTDTKNVLVEEVGSHRLDNPYSLDLRLSKDFRFGGVGMELAVDAFNVTNERTVLQRNSSLTSRDAAVSNRNRITELQSPRVFRFGARFTF
jgi:hypothetical protein